MKLRITIVFLLTIILMLPFASTVRAADMLGIDVSRWQGQIDWTEVNRQVSFAIIKAGGADAGAYTDKQFERNRAEARRLGMLRGYYYYAGGGNPIHEAEHFASIVGPLEPGEIVVLDYEVNHPNPVGFALQFMIRTEELLGVKPYFYTYMNKIWSYDWTPVVNNGNPLWGAIYDGEPLKPIRPGAWPNLAIKQYTSSGMLRGITSNTVDMNYFGGSAEEFLAFGAPAPAPPPPPLLDYEGVKMKEEEAPSDEQAQAGEPAAGTTDEGTASPDGSTDEASATDEAPAEDGAPAGEEAPAGEHPPAGSTNPVNGEQTKPGTSEKSTDTGKEAGPDGPASKETTESAAAGGAEAGAKSAFESFVKDVMYPVGRIIPGIGKS